MPPTDQLTRLSTFEPIGYPVVSLYLNTQPDQHGRDHYQVFVRKEFKARTQTYPPRSRERESLERDLQKITSYLEAEVQPSANTVAVFACDAAQLFETVQLEAPLDDHFFYIGDRPHLYPYARTLSQYPRYVALLADTNSSRIVVVAEGRIAETQSLDGVKTRRTKQGGSSQPRFQRHIENFHLRHVKDVVDALDRIVRRDQIEYIVIAGDPVVLPLIREQLPKHLAERVVDELKLAADAGDNELIKSSLQAMKSVNVRTDREKVDAAVSAFRAGGLGVVGPDETLLALTNGQVDELVITASLAQLKPLPQTPAAELAMANDAGFVEPAVQPAAAGEAAQAEVGTVRLADELVSKAHQTSARVTFIEDPALLKPYGGVAALLRFRI